MGLADYPTGNSALLRKVMEHVRVADQRIIPGRARANLQHEELEAWINDATQDMHLSLHAYVLAERLADERQTAQCEVPLTWRDHRRLMWLHSSRRLLRWWARRKPVNYAPLVFTVEVQTRALYPEATVIEPLGRAVVLHQYVARTTEPGRD